jgi:cytochrome c oxidase subunit 2
VTAVGLLLVGCGDNGQNTLHPHSTPARHITNLWWGMLVAAVVVFGGTCTMLLVAWVRRRREGLPFVGVVAESTHTRLVVLFGIVVPILTLSVLFGIADIGVIKDTEAPAKGTTRLTINVVGRQWFWEFHYPGGVTTADEMHIPAGTRVLVRATTADVIHSFWVPELNRKIDTIPGHPNPLLLYAAKPGRYRGGCAEFCGLQHAHMSFEVIADPPGRFQAWLAGQRRPPAPPQSASARQGESIFMSNACASCHTISGTPARGTVGPDLSHLALRRSLGALTIPNDPQHLLRWITDPQDDKPGVKMPGLGLQPQQFRAIRDYLETLR